MLQPGDYGVVAGLVAVVMALAEAIKAMARHFGGSHPPPKNDSVERDILAIKGAVLELAMRSRSDHMMSEFEKILDARDVKMRDEMRQMIQKEIGG